MITGCFARGWLAMEKKLGEEVIVFCKMVEPGIRVIINIDFEGFCLVGSFLKL